MTTKSIDQKETNIFASFSSGVISLIVGVSAFFAIKLLFMVIFNIFIALGLGNPEMNKNLGSLLVILAIFHAIKYTKKLNRSGTKKSRNVKRIITILIGVVCMFGSTLAIVLVKSGALTQANFSSESKINSRQKMLATSIDRQNNFKPVVVVTLIERAKGATEKNFDDEALNRLEDWRKMVVINEIKKNYDTHGFDFDSLDKNLIKTDSVYVRIDGKKLAVITLAFEQALNAVYISGIKDDNFYTVTCLRMNNIPVNFLEGKCANEIEKALEIKLVLTKLIDNAI